MTLLTALETCTIDWSRAQFALTACYHWLFVPLTLGLALIQGVMETLYYTTKDERWKRTAQFWMKLFGINFAIGVATGLILEFGREIIRRFEVKPIGYLLDALVGG